MLLTTKLTVHSQVTSIDSSQIENILDSRIANSDSLKCFTYDQARKIITDLQQLPLKDSIINRLDSIVRISDTIIKRHEFKIDHQRKDIFKKELKIESLKKNRKYLVIFGGIMGLVTQLLF
jgi:hypothetical protein